RDPLVALRIPARHDIGDAQPKPVAVGKAEGRVVDESGRRHGVLGDAGMNPDVMLANAADRCARDALEAPPLLGKGAMVLERREAAVEADLVAAATDLREDPACLSGLGPIGEVARADRAERGRA